MNRKVSNKFIGIDLGTTNSCIAIMEGRGIRVLESPEGPNTTPSVVSFEEVEEAGKPTRIRYLVGEVAKRQAGIKPAIFSVKGLMGKTMDEEVKEKAEKRG